MITTEGPDVTSSEVLSKTSQNSPKTTHPEEDKKAGSAYNGFGSFLRRATGHDIQCFVSFDTFVHRCMYRRVDGAALGVARALFGLAMLIDIPEERGGGDLDLRWGEPRDCRFPLIHSMESTPALPKMGIIYGLMWLGAAGIMVGYRYRTSAAIFTGTYWYIFLLDKSAWNNHSYLYGLLGTIFLFTDANRCWSFDAWQNPAGEQTVPFWNYFILKFQFFVLYFVAGLKKLCREWLSGYAMTNLSYHWVFFPFRALLGPHLTDLLIVHWFGCIFDTTVVFFLVYGPTRKLATLFASAFHLMNSRLFHIGMFPWVCLSQLPLYYSFSWPRRILLAGGAAQSTLKNEHPLEHSFSRKETPKPNCRRRKCTMMAMLAYCLLQLFLPYSHFLTKGYNNWTNGLYGYSWDMMVHAWDTIMIGIRVVDRQNPDRVHYVEPFAFTDNDRWTKHADMAVQFARCIERNVQQEALKLGTTPTTPGSIGVPAHPNVSIYFDIWCSMNGRFQQRIFDPNVDILQAPWSPFEPVQWVLPLLHQFSALRDTLIRRKTDEVLGWSNHSDVLFIADFPGLTLRNYVGEDLYNVSLTILQGSVRYGTSPDEDVPASSVILHAGQSASLPAGTFHAVETIGKEPSCYMYTYVNRTKELETNRNGPDAKSHPAMLPLGDELLHRWENFVRFLQHVGNSALYELYGVPMPRRLKELVADG